MSDDIETLREFIRLRRETFDKFADKSAAAFSRLVAERDRLQGRVATLEKALDDRWAADLKAAKAIFTATGRKWGFPDNVEVVAWYVAEVERLEKVLDGINVHRNALLRETDSLRAKADRAREAIDPLCNFAWSAVQADCDESCAYLNKLVGDLRTALSELSADAPVQRTYDPRFDGDPSTWPLYNPARQQPITPPTREWCERMAKREGDQEIGAGKSLEQEKTDPRDPDPTRKGIFRDHNCWKCNSGANPCIVENPSQCKYPHARND